MTGVVLHSTANKHVLFAHAHIMYSSRRKGSFRWMEFLFYYFSCVQFGSSRLKFYCLYLENF